MKQRWGLREELQSDEEDSKKESGNKKEGSKDGPGKSQEVEEGALSLAFCQNSVLFIFFCLNFILFFVVSNCMSKYQEVEMKVESKSLKRKPYKNA